MASQTRIAQVLYLQGQGGDVAGSDLDGKVRIKLLDGKSTTKVVPASHVEAIGGKLWIPRWLASQKANGRQLAGPFRLPEPVEAGLFAIERELELQVKLLEEAARPLIKFWIDAAPERAALEEQEMQERQAEQARRQLLADKASRLEMAKKKKSIERIHALPIHAKNAKVQGRDWVRKNGNFKSVGWELENATVRVSGKRAYIFLHGQDQPEFWKPLNTIQIIRSQAQ